MKSSFNKCFYILSLVVFIGIIGLVLFGATVRHVVLETDQRLGTLGELALVIAEFPKNVRNTLYSGNQELHDVRFSSLNGFKKDGTVYPGAILDDGYLLLSSYSADQGQSTVQLVQINTQKVLYEWVPSIDNLNEININSENYSFDYISPANFRLLHPVVLEGGRLIFNSGSGLYGINACAEVDTFIDGTIHHSNEMDYDGNIWTPSVIYPHSFSEWGEFRDDSIKKISPFGENLFEKSIAEILVENNYGFLLAIGGGVDPIHINDIQPALTDTKFWQKDDLLMSLRNRSVVMLYRPSTNKILWLEVGPWMNQHDVNFVDDHTISVFGNDVINLGGKNTLFSNYNSVYTYDFETEKLAEPYKKIMQHMEVKTLSEGRGTILADGDLFIDESNNGRLLRVSRSEVKWEYVRRIDENNISMSSWSRYLTPQEATPILADLEAYSCK